MKLPIAILALSQAAAFACAFFCSGVKPFQVSRFIRKPIAGPDMPSG